MERWPFEHPQLLWLFPVVLVGLSLFLAWSWRKRRWLMGQFVQSRLLSSLTVGVSQARQKARLGILVIAAGLLVLVLARPQWGFTWEEARQRGLDIIVAIDTSRSMLAEDVQPNRLARAKLAALDLKRLAKTDRVGLVAFAGSAFLQCPLSFDDEAFRQSVRDLDVNIIPQGGTAIAEAIDTARHAFKEKNDNHKVLVLFTDGEDHDGAALDSAKAAAKEGMRIFTVGVGTRNGEMLRITDSRGRVEFIKDDQGNAVKSHLNDKLLNDISRETGGFYMLLAGANTVDVLYEQGLSPLPKADLNARQVKRFHERYQWFLALVILLLIAEMFIPERKMVRKSEAILNQPNQELRKAVATLLLLALPVCAFSSPGRGLSQYEAGKYDSSLREYQNALHDHPNDPRLQYNAGAAAYQAKRYDKAIEFLTSSLSAPDLKLQQRAYYNLGNAQFRLGEDDTEAQKKQESWESSVQNYESALKLDPNDIDAKYNLELVKKKLEELKQQQQKQQQQNQDNKDNKDDKKDQKEKQDQQQKEKEKQKQDQQKQEQDKQQQEQQKQEADKKKQEEQKQDQQKADQKKQDDAQAQKEQGEKDDKNNQGQAMVARMTPQQAAQLLDTQKSEEKAMMFIPENIRAKTNRHDRVFKDW
ncbi:MAG TPA: VWA domain-containing protein [Verrucomicrobiae bacterium]